MHDYLLYRQEGNKMINSSSTQAPITMLQTIFDKVRTLCKECDLNKLPVKLAANDVSGFITATLYQGQDSASVQVGMNPADNSLIASIGSYVNALDELRTRIFEFHELEEEYKKLEAALQKNETEIRKHIGIEQQFRLYIDTIKGQFQQSENQRLELLENSKAMIKQLKVENQRLCEKINALQEGRTAGVTRCPDSDKKNVHIRNKERIKSEHCSSLHINQHRHYTENTYMSPIKERIKPHDLRIELTQRIQSSKKKKLTDIKKKQNYTVMAYIGHKKRQSKDKNQYKKGLLSFSNKKKINFGSEIKSKQMSEKKVNKSVFSLQSIDYNKQE